MRALLFLTVFLCSMVSFAQQKRSSFIKERPTPARMVNDFGKFLTKPEKDYLEQALNSFGERKGYSVVIITLPVLTDKKGKQFTIEETAKLYFNKWGINNNVKNDGVLIMLSKQPLSIGIHTGSGMATLLTNENCNSIINKSMAPAFRTGLYFTGIKDAVKEIETAINDNEAANKAQTTTRAVTAQQAQATQGISEPVERNAFAKFLYGFIALVILLWLFFRYRLKKAVSGTSNVYSRSGSSRGGDVVTSNNIQGGGRRKSWVNSSGSSSGSSLFSGSSGYSSGSTRSSGSGAGASGSWKE